MSSEWPREVIELVKQAEALIRKGGPVDLIYACDALDQASFIIPNDPIILVTRGKVLLQIGDIESARNDFKKAVSLSPKYSPSLMRELKLDRFLDDNAPSTYEYSIGNIIEEHNKAHQILTKKNIKGKDIDWSIVFIYLGTIPMWHIISLNQARLFNDNVDIYLICDESVLNEQWMKLLSTIKIVTIQSLGLSENHKTFKEITTAMFKNMLFYYATERLFYLETFMTKFNLLNVIHIESDVLIYTDLYKIVATCNASYNMAVTPVGAHTITLALLYVKDCSYLSQLNDFLVEKLAKGPDKLEKEIFDCFSDDDPTLVCFKKEGTLISEMILINLYRLYHGDDRLGFLPILPTGPHSYNIKKLHSIFDGASWGQYIGGTGKDNPGVAWKAHYVGSDLLEKKHEVIWKKDRKKRMIPYCKTGARYTKINNLHIHSKKLELFKAEKKALPHKEEINIRLTRELESFQTLWDGGFFEGDPLDPLGMSGYSKWGLGLMSVLHATYLRCIKPYINSATVALEIGPGRGGWTKAMLPAKEIYGLDALSAEHNKFFEYLGHPKNVQYFQVMDFKCKMLPDDYFNYMFSFGCLCHVSFEGITEYATNIYPKLKHNSHCFWMIADYDKYNAAYANLSNMSREEQQQVFRQLTESNEPNSGRWFHAGIKRTCAMLSDVGYRIIDPDVGTCLRDPIIYFMKE